MSHRDEMDRVFTEVVQWPAADRVAFAYRVLCDMRVKTLGDPPRDSVPGLLGCIPSNGTPPNDDEAKAIYRKALIAKYGR